MAENKPSNSKGICDLETADNHFRDFNIMYLSYRIGDAHIGRGICFLATAREKSNSKPFF